MVQSYLILDACLVWKVWLYFLCLHDMAGPPSLSFYHVFVCVLLLLLLVWNDQRKVVNCREEEEHTFK